MKHEQNTCEYIHMHVSNGMLESRNPKQIARDYRNDS